MSRCKAVLLTLTCALFAAGCPKGGGEYKQGRSAEALRDYDSALLHYQKALKADPFNANYKIHANQIRFEAGQFHVHQGQLLREKGDLPRALAEFQKALDLDPSSPIAAQELQATLDLINGKHEEPAPSAAPAKPAEAPLAEGPPQLMPLSRNPINLKMVNESRIIFETIAKMAGLTAVFDPDFQSKRITTEINNVTLDQALDIVSLQSKSFWKPVTPSIIFVVSDQAQKRRDYEEQMVRTFYLSNVTQPQDLTEVVTGLRQLLDLKRIQQVNSQNAIIIRDTPDKLLLAEKLINDIDKAKPEVVIQVEVLQARIDRLRDLGILPGQSTTLTFTPGGVAPTATSGSSSLPINQLKKLTSGDYSLAMPGATATAILSDNNTKIIQNPEIRSVDGQPAKLRIGDRIPVATGSFQAGVGIGGTGGVNPLVNTQFQYQDVGVNVDVTPRVHPNREVSLKIQIEVSSVTGSSTIGGIQQPIISQRKIDHEIRLKEGEVNILGGLIERVDSKTLKGWPGLAKLPLLHYLFSEQTTDHQENEVLIVLIPRIVRLPTLTPDNLRSLSSGSDANIQVRREELPQPAPPPSSAVPAPAVPQPPPAAAQGPRLHFDPQLQNLKPGDTVTLGVVVDNVQDLFSIPMLLQYNPAIISVEEVRHGGFLSGGTQEIAIVQRVDKERGQAIISATRQPNTAGVSGSGTLMGIVIRALAPGSSSLSIVQVNAKNSQQATIPLLTGEATIQVVR
ncbi:MAG: tetratricopeptide repeat protein [Acidobacteriia bacterium]|nr:tetratricopeptide repeat protein [Terriglobia bacterium]